MSRRPATSFGITAISPGEATENNGIKQAILDAVDFVRENGPQLMVQAFKRQVAGRSVLDPGLLPFDADVLQRNRCKDR
ncbi:hypothetical protein [Paracoccus siganidrum]|uniref:hypothetical protein n=1 Tax=Paracoccus siganidrum TaxID=1276757 RepID=UPI0011C3FDC3|nr:hypothetical protein [Paracoccus siganidrum]